jgi:RimJ/RimL family protein N-acetyltransferase
VERRAFVPMIPPMPRAPGQSLPRWRRRLATASSVTRRLGPRGVAFLLLERAAPSPWMHTEWFVVTQAELRGDPFDAPVEGLRWGSAEDLPEMLRFGRDEALLRERLAHGDRVAIRVKDRLVAYAWFRGGEYDEQGIVFRLAPGELWGYDVWVDEEHRSRGYGPRLLRATSRALAAEGFTRLLGTIDHLNEASLRASRWAGYAPVGSIWLLRVLGVSVRREAWEGRRPRWSVYRGAAPIAVPGSEPSRGEVTAVTA